MRVFLTGAASCLAKALLHDLCELPQVTQVFGIDLRPVAFHHPKFTSAIQDVRDGKLNASMKGYDAVIHLAFAIAREDRTAAEMYDTNVEGTLRVLNAAHQHGARRIINLSSVSVYGRGENLVETAPLSPSSVFAYAMHKAEIERKAAIDFPNVVHLRAHLIFGPNAQPFLHSISNSRIYIAMPQPAPVLQVVHEKDVAEAILLALQSEVVGAFNLAAPQSIALADLIRNGRKLMIPVPLKGVRKVVSFVRRFADNDQFVWLDVMDTTLTVNCDRAQKELHWRPRFTAWDARNEMDASRSTALKRNSAAIRAGS